MPTREAVSAAPRENRKIVRMTTKIYEVMFEKLNGETHIILAGNFQDAVAKAEALKEKTNRELKEEKDSRYPDDIGSIELYGSVDD